MKNITTILLVMLLSIASYAQQGINYKAIIKDGNGDIIANDLIQINFSILQGATQTNVYEETHSPTTDANGLVILNIGEGTVVSGDYNLIDWGSQDHFLNVQVNTGGGLVDLGTTEFKTVPYAIYAEPDDDWTLVSGFDVYRNVGRVGIGTSTPSTTLHLKQASSTYFGGIRLEPPIDTGEDWYIFMDSNDDLRINNDNNSNHGIILEHNTGNLGIGTANPSTKLQIFGGTDASLVNGSGYLLLGSEISLNVVFDNNEIMARNNGAAANLVLQNEGGSVVVGGSIVHSSDRRLKEDINDLSYGLDEILQLQPKDYYWKNRDQSKKSLGLIAQDVQPIIKEVVQTADDDIKTLSISYTELIPVLIKAIQEQHAIINSQQVDYNSLLERVEGIEELVIKSKY